jgi:hypothetical protein
MLRNGAEERLLLCLQVSNVYAEKMWLKKYKTCFPITGDWQRPTRGTGTEKEKEVVTERARYGRERELQCAALGRQSLAQGLREAFLLLHSSKNISLITSHHNIKHGYLGASCVFSGAGSERSSVALARVDIFSSLALGKRH